jgi:DNA polymerase-3 subunit delta
MKIAAQKLKEQLAKGGEKAYWICGDETLLVQESCDLVRDYAKQQGFTNREVWHVEAGFDWQEVFNSANSMSLFGDRQLLELRLGNGKPTAKILDAIASYVSDPNPDTLLLIIGPKIDAATMRGKKFLPIEQVITIAQVWPIEPQQLPEWISARLAAKNLTADNEALTILCERVEGNLLAAQQEIEKLSMLTESNHLDAEAIISLVADSARYDVFSLSNKVLLGDTSGALKTLRGLRAEGTDTTQILWVLAKEVRNLVTVSELAQTSNIDTALRQARIYQRQQGPIKQALKRHSHGKLQAILKLSHQIDLTIKGMAAGNPWDGLEKLILSLSAMPVKRN